MHVKQKGVMMLAVYDPDKNGVIAASQLGSHGAAQHTDVTRELFIPVNEGHIETGTPGQLYGHAIVLGGYNADEPKIYFDMKVPDDFVSFISMEVVWITPGTHPVDMYWSFEARYAAEGQSPGTHTESPAAAVTASPGAGWIAAQESGNPLTLVNLAIGDYIGFRFWRQGSNALDTLDSNANIVGFLFTYVANQ